MATTSRSHPVEVTCGEALPTCFCWGGGVFGRGILQRCFAKEETTSLTTSGRYPAESSSTRKVIICYILELRGMLPAEVPHVRAGVRNGWFCEMEPGITLYHLATTDLEENLQ